MLQLNSVTAGYGDAIVLREVDFAVEAGQVVALLGPNGAGKTTLLRTASGLIRPRSGRVVVEGADLTGRAPHRYARRGVCHLPEGRGIFPSLSVQDNLTAQCRGRTRSDAVAEASDLFPVLGERLGQVAGSLSGGEQQMLALCRAYLTSPKVVVVDEPSLGLAPRVIDQIYEALARLVQRGLSLVIVEQYVHRALALADSVYILSRGSVVHSGPAAAITPDEIYDRYLGGQS
jgi:branched-chain amino acid transport system ATP-binding protein